MVTATSSGSSMFRSCVSSIANTMPVSGERMVPPRMASAAHEWQNASVSPEPFMEAALEQARLALAAGEGPNCPVLVIDDAIVARAYNPPNSPCDPTAHAKGPLLGDA